MTRKSPSPKSILIEGSSHSIRTTRPSGVCQKNTTPATINRAANTTPASANARELPFRGGTEDTSLVRTAGAVAETPFDTIGVDTEDDLQRVEKILAARS